MAGPDTVFDARAMRDACGSFATGVTVISTSTPEGDHGMTANAFMSVSLDPPLISISLDRKSRMLDRIRSSGRYAVNVLAGDMSIVGPRPVIEDELSRYGASARWYTAVKPGVTGLWQVSGRNDTSYARRVALDVHYVRMQRIWLDAFILVKTIYVVLLGKGAH